MSNYELQLEPVRLDRNPINGRFLKNHTPHNKGKTWDECMSKRSQRRCRKGWKNLLKRKNRKKALVKSEGKRGRKKRKVIAVFEDGRFTYFESLSDAAKITGNRCPNIRRCCTLNKERKTLYNRHGNLTGKVNTDHHCKGIRFYCEDDPIWMTKIKRD